MQYIQGNVIRGLNVQIADSEIAQCCYPPSDEYVRDVLSGDIPTSDVRSSEIPVRSELFQITGSFQKHVNIVVDDVSQLIGDIAQICPIRSVRYGSELQIGARMVLVFQLKQIGVSAYEIRLVVTEGAQSYRTVVQIIVV